MKIKLTPEMVRDVGKEWRDFVISTATPEELIAKYDRKKLLPLMKEFSPEERLMGLGLEERLTGLEPEEIETYLKKLKKSKKMKKSDS